MIMALGVIFNSLISCIIYYFIILPRKNEKNNNAQLQNSITPYLIGYGVIMPICVFSPYYGLRYFYIKNKMMKFFAGIAQLTSFFRCSEAMFGFLPEGVDNSLANLLFYMAFPMEIKFDKGGPIKSTWSRTQYLFLNWIMHIFILGMYTSVLSAYDYEPFENKEGPSLLDIKFSTLFTREQLINNALIGILFQIYLTTFGYGLNFIISLLGYHQAPFMLNPIFESSSPSDFWGKRWNMSIHGLLKRGVYKPVRIRMKMPRLVALAAAFLASGIFHEWLLSVVFYPDYDDGSCSPICYQVGYGRNILFFLWNAVLIGLEYAIGGATFFKLCSKHLPVTVVSILIVMTVMPAAHWFTNDYVRSDFMKDVQTGFPMIVRVID